jgi:hypothetical protein
MLYSFLSQLWGFAGTQMEEEYFLERGINIVMGIILNDKNLCSKVLPAYSLHH